MAKHQGGGDAKLRHLVQKYYAVGSNMEDDDSNNTNLCDHIIATITVKHREYRRRDPSKLRYAVQAIIDHINVADADDDDEYERAAAERDSRGGGTSLNASLCSRYARLNSSTTTSSCSSAVIISDHGTAAATTGTADPAAGVSPSLSTRKKTKSARKQADDGVVAGADDDDAVEPPASSSSPRLKRRKVRKSSISSSTNIDNIRNQASPTCDFLVADRPTERLSDLGGMMELIQTIRQVVVYPLIHPELYHHLGVEPARGVLLRGPPGTGKTHLANAIAGELGLPYFRIAAPELVSGVSGESESRIRELFRAASATAPAIMFIDEIDAVAAKREGGGGDSRGSSGMEKRMVAQLLTCLDSLAPANNRNRAAVMVLAATNRPDAIDPALRRAGRFDKELLLGVPEEQARHAMLISMTANMRIDPASVDYADLAKRTPGFVGADLKSLAKEAANVAIARIFRQQQGQQHETIVDQTVVTIPSSSDGNIDHPAVTAVVPMSPEQLEPLFITMNDFLMAVPLVQPSSKREGFATVPGVSWDDIGALQSIREELHISVLEPIRHPEKFHQLGLPLPAGVLLFGPPGCGKTLLAKAIANESGANFISVKGPELLDKYVGESEKAVRTVFERARSSSPCIVFFDELDSLVPRRGSDHGGGGSGVSERVVNQLLTEMDGLDCRRSVFVIAATNRPELIDPAMLRPGRLDKLLYVPLPTAPERVSILQALAAKVALSKDVDLAVIGGSIRAEGYSGADCAALLREAGLAVMKENNVNTTVPLCITAKHFDLAFDAVIPSVSKKDQARYDRLRDKMAKARTRDGTTGVMSIESAAATDGADDNAEVK